MRALAAGQNSIEAPKNGLHSSRTLHFVISAEGEHESLPAVLQRGAGEVQTTASAAEFTSLAQANFGRLVITCAQNGKDRDRREILDLLKAAANSPAEKIVYFGHHTRKLPAEFVAAVKELDAAVVWDKRAFLRYKVEQFGDARGLSTVEQIAERLNISDSTLYAHMRRDLAFTSRVWARLCTGLGITPEERDEILAGRVKGFSLEEREELEGEIRDVVASLLKKPLAALTAAPGEVLNTAEVYEDLLRRAPELANLDRQMVAVVIRDVRDQLGYEDSRLPVLKRIEALQRQLGAIHDDQILEALRQTMLGNMFEELALLMLQVDGCQFVPQYCLTVHRDGLGRPVHTTDILDIVTLEPQDVVLVGKAFIETQQAAGSPRYELMAAGRIEVELRPGRDDEGPSIEARYINAANGRVEQCVSRPWLWFKEAEPPDFSGLWVKYRDHETGMSLLVERDRRASCDMPARGLMDDSFWKARLEGQDLGWEPARPFTGVEVKKAGCKDVTGIVNQLRRQRDACLRAREHKPGTIPALISRIDVVVLHGNPALQRAIAAMNEEVPFFRYCEFSSANGGWEQQLERRTLEEAALLRRFFTRLNQVLAEQPTLRPLAELHDQILTHWQSEQLDEGRVLRYVDAYLDREVRRATMAQSTKQVRAALAELQQQLAAAPCISEEMLEGTFQRCIPDLPYRPKTLPASAMNVWEEVSGGGAEGALMTFPRMFGRPAEGAVRGGELDVLLRKAAALAGRFGEEIKVDLEREESLETFVTFLEMKLAARARAAELQQSIEHELHPRFLTNRFGSPEAFDRALFDRCVSSFSVLEGGIIAHLRAATRGSEVRLNECWAQEALIVLAADGLVLSRKQNGEPSLMQAARLAVEAVRETEAGGLPLMQQGAEFADRLAAAALQLLPALEQPGGANAVTALQECHRALRDAEQQYRRVLELPVLDGGRELVMAMRRRADFAVSMTKAIEGSKDLSAFLAELDGKPVPEAENFYSRALTPETLLGADFAAIRPRLEELMAKAVHATCAALRHHPQDILAAVHTRYGFIEQHTMHAFLSYMSENALALCHVSHWLAADYARSSLKAMINHPAVYGDLYLKELLAAESLLREHGRAVLEYQRWKTAQPQGEHGDSIELLRRLVVLRLQDTEFVQPPRSEGCNQFFAALAAGKFAEAERLEQQGALPTYRALGWVLGAQEGDIHLNWLRHWQFAQAGIDRTRQLKGEGLKVWQEIEPYLAQLRQQHEGVRRLLGYELLPDGSVELNHLPKRRLEQLRLHVRELLEAAASLPNAEPGNIMPLLNERHYRGTRYYNKAQAAIPFILDQAPGVLMAYYENPAWLLRFADYAARKPLSGRRGQ